LSGEVDRITGEGLVLRGPVVAVAPAAVCNELDTPLTLRLYEAAAAFQE
jgi:hypothetical protein